MRASQRRRGVRFEVRAACRAGPDGLIALPGCSPALLRAIPTLTRPTLARYLSADARSHKHVNRPLAPRRAGRILATFVGDRTWHIAMNRPEQVSKHVNQATRAR